MPPRIVDVISSLTAAALAVAIGATALGFAIVEFQQSDRASQTVFALAAIESALDQEIANNKNYGDESTRLALRSGRLPPALVFNLKVQLPSGERALTIHPNETLTMDRTFQKCSKYPIGECGYKVKLTLEQHPAAFSYSVASAFPEAALSLDRNDRSEIVIPKSFYRDVYQISCDSRREIGLMGFVSSDRYACLAKPQIACGRGTLPKSLVVDPKTRSLEFECGPASKVVRCPASYALASIDTKSLDAGSAKINAQCVRTTASVAMPAKQMRPAIRLAGRACPVGYKSDSTCALVNVVSKAGSCGTGAAQPVAGKLRFTQNKTQGSVDCGVDIQSQSCGAVWQGLAQLTIRCVLDQPEFSNAL